MVFLSVLNQVRENISKIIEEKGYDKVTFVVEPSRVVLVISPAMWHFC